MSRNLYHQVDSYLKDRRVVVNSTSLVVPNSRLSDEQRIDTLQRGFAQKICKSYCTISLNATVAQSGLHPRDLSARICRFIQTKKEPHKRLPQAGTRARKEDELPGATSSLYTA
ncbi:hypothetical protein EVAR_46019_1 [Eumeta japonica]|uniref:Uncharacterized protein n=1 Tax=Eumeta variegata TaxID=151549 RepID=A0A4C1Z2I4_EUMVA|nr:hypothetical protein EVAR_46019_1 [Eumeta japonica]